ncbi:hypothetical protein ABWH96_14270 [Marivirga tractuosa]|uniref:hypothetical protein n=1 Tax=Marivirga tractuosa TaxID=1006 RepID=UPI0035CF6337
MKTHHNILKPVNQNILIGFIFLITLFGLSLNANAQSTLLENDIDKINNSMVVQLADYDYDIVIPKVSSEELKTLKETVFNQLVYVSDGDSGYYFYMGNEWEKQNVSEVFELIDMNLAIQRPDTESLIIVAGAEKSNTMMDYNHHVKNIYQDFGFDTKDEAMAINIRKE